MAQISTLKALANYFNDKNQGSSVGGYITIDGERRKLSPGIPGCRPLREFATELKDMTDVEKEALALEVCAITGDTLAAVK